MPKALHWHKLAMKGGNVVFLRTETLVDALAVFMAFWKQHVFFFEDRAHYLLHHLTQDMRTMCAQYARQRGWADLRHLQKKKTGIQTRKNRFQLFVSPCPLQAETKC